VWLELKEYVRFAGKTIIVNMVREAAGAIRLKFRSMSWIWFLTIKRGKPAFAGLVWKNIKNKTKNNAKPCNLNGCRAFVVRPELKLYRFMPSLS